METTALYIGYAVMVLIVIALIGMSLLVLSGTALGLYRILKYKQTSRFIRKHETKAMYKTCKVAVQFLISKGVSPENTLEEALGMIEKYKKHFKIKGD